MATIVALETEVAAAVEGLPSSPTRLVSDYDDDFGQILTRGSYFYRLRLDNIEKISIGSNRTEDVIQIIVDVLVRLLGVPPAPAVGGQETAIIWPDQQTFTTKSFWEDMAAVKEIVPDTSPQVVEEIQRTGDVLRYQVAVDVLLQS